MTTDGYSFEGCEAKLDDAKRLVLDKETAYEKAIRNAAESEAFYRSKIGDSFKANRADGKGVEESTTLARAACVVQSKQRDADAGLVKLAAEQLEDARDERRSLWRLVEWARERDLITARAQQQPVPVMGGVGWEQHAGRQNSV